MIICTLLGKKGYDDLRTAGEEGHDDLQSAEE
jgi:hypothetical protein